MDRHISNREMYQLLPNLKDALSSLENGKAHEYESKLDNLLKDSMDNLSQVISDGTLALDLEQSVKAVEVLTKAKSAMIESKRKLIETVIKGEIMLKALEPPKKENDPSSVLLEYLQKNQLDTTLDKTGVSPGSSASIFESIAASNEELESNEETE